MILLNIQYIAGIPSYGQAYLLLSIRELDKICIAMPVKLANHDDEDENIAAILLLIVKHVDGTSFVFILDVLKISSTFLAFAKEISKTRQTTFHFREVLFVFVMLVKNFSIFPAHTSLLRSTTKFSLFAFITVKYTHKNSFVFNLKHV